MPVPAYKISKAALSMLTVQYAHQYVDEGFTFLGISPGVSQVIVVTSHGANMISGSAPTSVALGQIFRLKQAPKRPWISYRK
jgi:NAD(P)-dependent dehydrogenase (short-subunit alcohol dehydrogenase family)